MKVCQLCKQEGHYAVDCPDDPNKHALVLLPELSDAHYAMLDNVLEKVYSIHCPSPSEIDHPSVLIRLALAAAAVPPAVY